jgi:hypothetical protein
MSGLHHHSSAASCNGDCLGCAANSDQANPPAGPFVGGALGRYAMLYFGWPMVCTVTGAIVGGDGDMAQFVGGVAGFAVGTLTAVAMARLVTRRIEATP